MERDEIPVVSLSGDSRLLIKIILRKMALGQLDKMFAESFGKYMLEEHSNVQFAIINESLDVLALVEHDPNLENDENQTVISLRANPYVKSIELEKTEQVFLRKTLETELDALSGSSIS